MISKLKILIVEDSSATRDYYKLYLEQYGYQVMEAYNGLEALERLAAYDFDAAIVDINMPKMDGYQFIRELRRGELVNRTPVAVISSEKKESDLEQAYQAGANAYLVKPVKPEQLAALLELLRAGEGGEEKQWI
jgi:two-component system, chemotaxis family, chemotaxis protein CheY